MSEPKVTIQSGDFQIDPKSIDTHNMLLNAAVKSVVEMVNHLDLNHDGKADIAQIAPVIERVLPFAIQLAPMVHPDKLVDFLSSLPIFKDPAAAKVVIEKVAGEAVKVAAELAPKA